MAKICINERLCKGVIPSYMKVLYEKEKVNKNNINNNKIKTMTKIKKMLKL